jgi:hypothetical protein
MGEWEMVDKADFRQSHEFTRADFERHPAWIGVHNYDYGNPGTEKPMTKLIGHGLRLGASGAAACC